MLDFLPTVWTNGGMDTKDAKLIRKKTMDLSKDEIEYLKAHFVRLYHRKVPKRVSPTFLHGNVAWGLQAEAQGHDPVELRQQLVALARQCKQPRSNRVSEGTQLVREWKGQTYIVSKSGNEYLYEDKRYKSLSAIAKVITGNHVSGPKFFGLNKHAAKK